MLTTDILQNEPFRRQISKIFFAWGGKGALTHLTKILFTAANQVVTLTRVTNERVVKLGRLVAGQFGSRAVNKS